LSLTYDCAVFFTVFVTFTAAKEATTVGCNAPLPPITAVPPTKVSFYLEGNGFKTYVGVGFSATKQNDRRTRMVRPQIIIFFFRAYSPNLNKEEEGYATGCHQLTRPRTRRICD
jgi:hypothetical protein